MTDANPTREIALEEYKEVVTQFRTLTDIRFKLLTYLPLGTVAAVSVPATNDLVKQPAISAFAFVVTVCIATYDKRNDQLYDELVSRAAELERELQIEHGSFSDRPKAWLKYGFVPVQHRWPIGLIYAAAASLWAYLFTAALLKDHTGLIWLKLAAPAAVIVFWQGLRWIEDARSGKQRKAVEYLMEQLLGRHDDSQVNHAQLKLLETITAARPILGTDKQKAERRVRYHWKAYEQQRDSRAASALLSAVIDLPARWIEDVWSGRR